MGGVRFNVYVLLYKPGVSWLRAKSIGFGSFLKCPSCLRDIAKKFSGATWKYSATRHFETTFCNRSTLEGHLRGVLLLFLSIFTFLSFVLSAVKNKLMPILRILQATWKWIFLYFLSLLQLFILIYLTICLFFFCIVFFYIFVAIFFFMYFCLLF